LCRIALTLRSSPWYPQSPGWRSPFGKEISTRRSQCYYRLLQLSLIEASPSFFRRSTRSRRENNMQRRCAIALAMIAGFAPVAFVSQTLCAQPDPPAYYVAVFDFGSEQEVSDTDHPSLAPGAFQPFGGRYVISSPRTIPFDGQPPARIVVIEFGSMERLQAWRASKAFKNLYDARKAAKVRDFAVEGIARGGD